MTIYTRGKYADRSICIDNGPSCFHAQIITDENNKRRMEPNELSDLIDRACLALNQMEVREAAPYCPWPVGTRVRLLQDFEYFPFGIIRPGEFGRVVAVPDRDDRASQDDVMGQVRLEKHHDDLNEWDNCILVMADAEYGITWAGFTPADDQEREG